LGPLVVVVVLVVIVVVVEGQGARGNDQAMDDSRVVALSAIVELRCALLQLVELRCGQGLLAALSTCEL
jgi:hypothetical protein